MDNQLKQFNTMASEDNWRTQSFRQSVVSKIEEVIQRSGMQVARNSSDMENHVFMKAKTREEYMNMAAKLILHVRAKSQPKPNQGAPNMQGPNQNQSGPSPQIQAQPGQPQQGPGNQSLNPDPINALQNLASQGSRNQMMNMGPQGQMQQQGMGPNQVLSDKGEHKATLPHGGGAQQAHSASGGTVPARGSPYNYHPMSQGSGKRKGNAVPGKGKRAKSSRGGPTGTGLMLRFSGPAGGETSGTSYPRGAIPKACRTTGEAPRQDLSKGEHHTSPKINKCGSQKKREKERRLLLQEALKAHPEGTVSKRAKEVSDDSTDAAGDSKRAKTQSSYKEALAGVKMAIIADDHPRTSLGAEMMGPIQRAVCDRLIATPDPLPVVYVNHITAGAAHVTCVGDNAVKWLYDLNGFTVEGVKLKVVRAADLPKPVKMAWKTRNVHYDVKTLLTLLQRLNGSLRTSEWKVVDSKAEGTHTRYIVYMDRVSADHIKERGYSLPGGIDRCTFKLLEDSERGVKEPVAAPTEVGDSTLNTQAVGGAVAISVAAAPHAVATGDSAAAVTVATSAPGTAEEEVGDLEGETSLSQTTSERAALLQELTDLYLASPCPDEETMGQGGEQCDKGGGQ